MQKSLIIFVFCTYISVSFQIPFAPINRVCGAYDIKPLNSFKILSYLFVRNCDHFCLNQNLALDPANIYLFKVNNKKTRKRCEIFSKLTIKTPERCQLTLEWKSTLLNVSPNLFFSLFFLYFLEIRVGFQDVLYTKFEVCIK